MRATFREQRGALMIEVLITLVVCVIGLWAMSRVQARLQLSEVESYQRSQALMLLHDMGARIELNRTHAHDYVTGSARPLGSGTDCAAGAQTLAQQDGGEWCSLLLGAAESSRGATRAGAMPGARGCIEDAGAGSYLITVVWQGMTPLAAPPPGLACGASAFDVEGTRCVDDLCRRAITTVVRIGDLAT